MRQFWNAITNALSIAMNRFLVGFRRLSSPAYILQMIIVRFRIMVTRMLDVKPKHKKDYYTFFGWMVSRRLTHLILFVVGVGCLIYIVNVQPLKEAATDASTGNSYSSYRYSSIPLRFLDKNVNIKAKDGYIAYTGAVKKGYASGQGTLYRADGSKVYEGNFEKSKYSGQGTLYYPSEQIEYSGEFSNNLYEGTGTLYRENGAKVYEGSFSKGLKEGEGILYNATDDQVFAGSFHLDQIIYSQLLNKSADEIGQLYTGRQLIYANSDDTENAVILSDIDVIYLSEDNSNSMDEAMTSDLLCIGSDSFKYGGQEYTTTEELTEVLGQPIYEGNSYLTMTEAVAIDWLQNRGRDIEFNTGLVTATELDELYTVNSYNEDASLYLHTYEIGEQTYTFLSLGKTGSFFMYEIE